MYKFIAKMKKYGDYFTGKGETLEEAILDWKSNLSSREYQELNEAEDNYMDNNSNFLHHSEFEALNNEEDYDAIEEKRMELHIKYGSEFTPNDYLEAYKSALCGVEWTQNHDPNSENYEKDEE